MTRPVLKAVPSGVREHPIHVNHLRRIVLLREQLMRATVTFVVKGKDGSFNDRLRTASELSGIPLTLLKVEIDK